MPRTLTAGTFAALLVTLVACAARASEEEWKAEVAVGGAMARADGRWVQGGQLGLYGRYGLTDAWNLGAGLSASLLPVREDQQRPGGLVRAVAATAGVTLAFDVLRTVPFVALGLAVQNLGGALRDARTDLGGELTAGADYLVDRRWTVGAAFACRVLPVALAGERGGTPMLLSLALRVGRVW